MGKRAPAGQAPPFLSAYRKRARPMTGILDGLQSEIFTTVVTVHWQASER